MEKSDVIHLLKEIAAVLEIRGENPFKSRAYLNAARTLEGFSGDFHELVESGKLSDLKGFGEGLTAKVTEYVTHGRMGYYEEIRKDVPDGLLEMLRIPNLGPKKIKALHDSLNLSSIEELEAACRENRVAGLKGFGEKTEKNILEGIAQVREHQGRFLLSTAMEAAGALHEPLASFSKTIRSAVGGSIRRRKETVKDIDLLVSTKDPEAVMDFFVGLPSVEKVTAKGSTKTSVRLAGGMACDLRAVTDEEFPYALAHFTGSREHNTAMRARAKEKGWKLNEYGLFEGEQNIPCEDEEAIHGKLGLSYIPPELREDWGEIEAAEKNEIPRLVEREDIKGVMHCHSNYSDGKNTLDEMAAAASALGFQYLGIADHSRSAAYAGGLSEDRVKRQWEEIDRVNASGKHKCRLLKGIESDILVDGKLDYPDELLEKFDFVIASVHSRFNLPEKEMTERIVRALQNPFTAILGHPTGRLLLQREPYALDIGKVIEAAARHGKMIEINCHPRRLDLDWRGCRKAKEAGVMVCLSPDAHDTEGLADVSFGVDVARKGWLEKENIFNSLEMNRALERLKG